MIESIVYSTITGVFIIFSFIFGISIGKKLNKGENIVKSPIKAIKEHKEQKIYDEKKAEQERIDEINEYNIDNYDGTGIGQKTFK